MATVKRVYLDRDLSRITLQRHMELATSRDFTIVREFENNDLFARIVFNSQHRDDGKIPQEHWKPFVLIVQNIITTDAEGNKLDEPARVKDIDASQKFRTEQEAIDSYEDLLVRHAHCEFVPSAWADSSGNPQMRLYEKGNKLLPPSKDVPVVEGVANEADFASW